MNVRLPVDTDLDIGTYPAMALRAKLNLPQRILNKIGKPLGMLPFPGVWQPVESGHRPRQLIFDDICRENVWGSRESVSGPGSEFRRTARYREALAAFLRGREITSVFDAPCGDLNWMGEVISTTSIRYVGGDISDAVLGVARDRFPKLDLRHFDICSDPFPDAQVWHCRDAFIHLSFADIWAALENASKSTIEYALLSTNRAIMLRNFDIGTGGARPLDLQRPPFNFPPAIQYFDDTARWEFPRAVAVWPIDAIRQVVAQRPTGTS